MNVILSETVKAEMKKNYDFNKGISTIAFGIMTGNLPIHGTVSDCDYVTIANTKVFLAVIDGECHIKTGRDVQIIYRFN